MPLIRFLLQRWHSILIVAVIASMVSGLSGVGLIAVINTALGRGDSMVTVWWAFAGLCLFLLLARITAACILMLLGQNAILDLRLGLSRQILAAPLSRLQQLGPSRLLANLTEDVATLAEAFTWFPDVCVNTAIVLSCLVYLGWLSMTMLWIVISAIILGVCSFRIIERRALRGLSATREHEDTLYGHFRDLTDGIKELKLHRPRREAFQSECLETTAANCRRHYLSGMMLYVFAINWGNGLFYVVIGIVLFVLPLWRTVPMETLSGYCLTILYMMTPLSVLVDSVPILSKASIALRKIEALGSELKNQAQDGIRFTEIRLKPNSCKLELIQVTHRYHREGEDHNFTLGPINLTLRSGELVFLIGGNGSGKTTLALLLVGLYRPETGEIRLDGEPITDVNREYYRQHFSVVFSDFYLFESLLGFESRELDEQGRKYLAQLQVDHKVKIENGKFSTLKLSQGQRKRLALLIAYLEDRPFYVFDEWAADQDPVFKKTFYMEIVPSLKARGKTVLVITHDDSYFHLADRCIKLEEGRLTETTPALGSRKAVAGMS